MKKLRLFICLYVTFQCLTISASKSVFFEKKVQIKVPDVVTLDSAARWYLNFDRLKKTVIYSNRIISMGLHGGLVCINPTKMELDSVFTKKINTSFYTNLICRQDTLFAEKFGKIFYLNRDTIWVEYNLRLPVKLFEIVYEDEHYIFYPSDFGEWGSSLFIYDKYLNCTKGLNVSDCPISVVKKDKKYIIGGGSYGGVGSYEIYSLKDLDKLKVIVKDNSNTSMEILKKYWIGSERLDYSYSKNFKEPIKEGSADVITIFEHDSILYYLEDVNTHKENANGHKYVYISNFNNNHIKIDSLDLGYLGTVNQYGKNTIVDCLKNMKSNFLYFNSDTIYNISYSTNKSYTFEASFSSNKNYYFTVRGEIINQDSVTKAKYYNENDVHSISTSYDINKQARISYYATGWDKSKADFFIIQNEKKHKMKFVTKDIFQFCFKHQGNDFLYFNGGNKDSKYGLIEILNLDRFIQNYCE